MHSATMLAKENSELYAANQRRKQKEQHRRRYIAQGGALQAQQAQALVEGLENREQEADQNAASQVRRRAPPTCSNCHIQGHNRLQCTSN